MKRWYLKNRDGRFAVVAWQQAGEIISDLTWTRDPTYTSLLDRDQLTRVMWKIMNSDNPMYDVITIEVAS